MTPAEPTSGPPLRVWGVVAAVCLAAIASVSLLPKPVLYPPLDGMVRSRLARLGPAGNGIRVVLVGRSSLKHATFEERRLEAMASTRGHGAIRVVKVTAYEGGMADLEPVMATVLSAGPDLVVIEPSLLIEEHTWKSHYRLALIRLRSLVGGPERWGSQAYVERMLDDHSRRCDEPDPRARVRAADAQARWWIEWKGARARRTTTGANAVAGQRFVTRAAALGVRVAIIEVPREARLQASLGIDAVPEAHAYFEQLERSDRTELWQPELGLEAEHYCDLVHMTPVGRALFSPWLVDRIAVTVGQR